MTRKEAIRFVVLRSLGNFLIFLSLYGVLATFGPAFTAEVKYQIMQIRGVRYSVRADSSKKFQGNRLSHISIVNNKEQSAPGFATILAGNKEQILTPIDPLFSILIPKLGIDERIFPNVDPANPNIYLPILQHGVAHAKGSVFPGNPGTTYLFAHSADNWWDIGRYNAVFYILGNVSTGDEIVIFFENRRYEYVVTQQIISDPQDSTLLTENHGGTQQLVLQTCWPPGTTWKRLYIIAKPKHA